jgi:hypothetical protein
VRRRLTLAIAALALTAGGCGGGSDRAASPPGSADNPLAAAEQREALTAGGRVNEAGAAKANGEAKAEAPGYQELLDRQSKAPRRRFTPCNLVSGPRAAAIVGTSLAPPVEAPQGPTCIYRSKTGEQELTIAVLALDFAKLRRTLHRPAQVDVGEETGYCSRRGTETLWVPLEAGRVLNVGASCGVATRFAAAAIRRLGA